MDTLKYFDMATKSAKEIGSDSTTVYTFNPITGTIKNGDNKYTKIG